MNEGMDKLLQAFEEFKSANDERIDKLEKGQHVPADLEEKVDRVNAEITRLEGIVKETATKANRPGFGTDSDKDELQIEHSKKFVDWMKSGDDSELKDFQVKSLNVTQGSDGEFAVPEEVENTILDLLQDASPMRSVCNVLKVGTTDWKKLVNIHGSTTGWVGEQETRSETTTPSINVVEGVFGELYAEPRATQHAIDDIWFDAESWLSEEVAGEFVLAENDAFTNGNGIVRPRGFLSYTLAETADSSRAFGTLEEKHTGTQGAFKTTSATVSPADDFIDIIYATKPGHRANANFMMTQLTMAAVRKFKDNDGAYIWQPGIQAGQPATLLGYPIVENQDMPEIGNDTVPVAFGDFRRGYTILDRMGVRVLRDPYTTKGFVKFYTTKRVGGQLMDSEAIKVITLSA